METNMDEEDYWSQEFASALLDVSFDDGVQDERLNSQRPSLPIANLLRKQQPPRLSALGVQDAVATVKDTNKKCRRQAKKKALVSASKS
ncbi:hypothetical protein PTKIN_Ptkin03bG0024700 [Pterospermum kingtungense]